MDVLDVVEGKGKARSSLTKEFYLTPWSKKFSSLFMKVKNLTNLCRRFAAVLMMLGRLTVSVTCSLQWLAKHPR